MSEVMFYWRWLSYPQALIEREREERKKCGLFGSSLDAVCERLISGGSVYFLAKKRAFLWDKRYAIYVSFDPVKQGVLMMIGNEYDESNIKSVLLDARNDAPIAMKGADPQSLMKYATNCPPQKETPEQRRERREQYRSQLAEQRRQSVALRERAIARLNKDGIDYHVIIAAAAGQVPEHHQKVFLKQVSECVVKHFVDFDDIEQFLH